MSGALHVVAPYLRRQSRALVVATSGMIVVAAAEILRPFPLKFVIDHLFAAGAGGFQLGLDALVLLAGVVALVLAIALVEAGGGYLMDVRLTRAGESIVHDLRIAIYAHLHRLSLGFHQQRHTGDLVTRVTGDVNAVGSLFSSSLGTLVSSGLTLIGMVVVGFLIDPLLAIVAFATAPLIAVVALRFRQRMGTLQRRQRTMEGEIASLASESLSSIQQVRALGSEQYEHERLERKSEERLEAGYEATLVEGRFTRLIDIVGAIGTAAVLVVGVFRVGEGALSPGDLVVMVAYVRRVYRPLRAMAREWVRFTRSIARAERVAELLSADDLLRDGGGVARPARARGALQLERVGFTYGTGRAALADVSFDIPAGQRVALVGPSGAGKSTLAALVARFYDPTEGRLLLDGADLRQRPLEWLRNQVGLVLQDPVLFTGTIAANIGWGLDDAAQEDIVRAASAVGADAFIRELPGGYQTELDPAGAGLSGGQRQRIAIARTLLRDPSVIILDEPTNGLDATSEREVLAGLDTLMDGRTTIIITHSLALARRADRVIVLEAGRVVESGTPDELLAGDGLFHVLAVAQGVVAAGNAAPRRARSQPPIEDPNLPQTALLLDASAAALLLERSFDRGRPLNVAVRYLRYKPSTNLVVHYEVADNGHRHDAIGMISAGDQLARRAGKPESVALARLAADRAAAASPLAYEPDIDGLFQWYPLDLSLPALARPPAELRRLMRGAGVPVEERDDEPQRLAYKPRRRAVLRVEDRVIKLYRRPIEYGRALVGQRAASRLQAVTAPPVEAALDDHLITVQGLLEGDPVTDARASATEVGELLAALHADPVRDLPVFEPQDQLRSAAASARLAATVAPELAARLERMVSLLEETMPRFISLVPAHGDFNARQLLRSRHGLAVTDFDEFSLASRELDPATYAAYLIRGRAGDLDVALDTLDALVGGYGGPLPHLRWYLATMILRRAARPFRYFEPEWRLSIGQMVAAAEGATARA